MAYSVAYQHTDSNRDNYGSYKLHGVKERKWDCQNLVVSFYITGCLARRDATPLVKRSLFESIP